VDALGTGPTHSAYESAALARIVAWASPEDCAAFTRLARKARRDAFDPPPSQCLGQASTGGRTVSWLDFDRRQDDVRRRAT
jgi:hypothetical protein